MKKRLKELDLKKTTQWWRKKLKKKKRDNKKNLGSTELSRKRCDHGYEIEIIS